MCGTSSHSDELTGDFGNKPEAILIGDHGLSCLLVEKLSLRDLRLLQQYRHLADIRRLPSSVREVPTPDIFVSRYFFGNRKVTTSRAPKPLGPLSGLASQYRSPPPICTG